MASTSGVAVKRGVLLGVGVNVGAAASKAQNDQSAVPLAGKEVGLAGALLNGHVHATAGRLMSGGLIDAAGVCHAQDAQSLRSAGDGGKFGALPAVPEKGD